MREFNRRQHYRHYVARAYADVGGLIVLTLITGLAVHASWNMYTKFALAAGSRESVESQLAQLKMQEARVGAAVAQLQTQRGIEQEVRERYGVALPGEGAIQIVEANATSSAQTSSEPGFWQRIWRALFVW